MNPNVYIGNMKDVDWKKYGEDDFDDELDQTPEDVKSILGFDPLDENSENKNIK